PSWIIEADPPNPPDFVGGAAGAGGEPAVPPPEMGGTADEDPDEGEPEAPPSETHEPGCSCRVSGPTEPSSRPAVFLFLSFLFLWGARRRSAVARAEVR